MLLLYVKQEHAAYISEVEAETVGTGIMGRMVSSWLVHLAHGGPWSLRFGPHFS